MERILAITGTATVLALLWLYGAIGPKPTSSHGVVVAPTGTDGALVPRDPVGPLRILLVGTSLTARGSWPRLLEAQLVSCAPRGVEVRTLARAGMGIRWGLPELRRRFAASEPPLPDIVVVEFAANDATLTRGLPLDVAKARTRDLIALVRSIGAVPFVSTMNPAWAEEWITRPGQARYHGIYRDVAAETGAGLIDTAPVWQTLPREDRRRLVPDNGHPTDEGAALITVPAFLDALRPLVCG
jgi:acyl-CoA thioesterase-1